MKILNQHTSSMFPQNMVTPSTQQQRLSPFLGAGTRLQYTVPTEASYGILHYNDIHIVPTCTYRYGTLKWELSLLTRKNGTISS